MIHESGRRLEHGSSDEVHVFQDHNDWIEIGDQHLLRSSSRGRKCSSKQINFKTIHSSSTVLIEISLQFLETSIVSTRYIIGNSIGDYHSNCSAMSQDAKIAKIICFFHIHDIGEILTLECETARILLFTELDVIWNRNGMVVVIYHVRNLFKIAVQRGASQHFFNIYLHLRTPMLSEFYEWVEFY